MSLASLTARKMSLAASCGLPKEERAPLTHMIIDRKSEKLELQHLICQIFESSSQISPGQQTTRGYNKQVDLRASPVNKIQSHGTQLQLTASESAWC